MSRFSGLALLALQLAALLLSASSAESQEDGTGVSYSACEASVCVRAVE